MIDNLHINTQVLWRTKSFISEVITEGLNYFNTFKFCSLPNLCFPLLNEKRKKHLWEFDTVFNKIVLLSNVTEYGINLNGS